MLIYIATKAWNTAKFHCVVANDVVRGIGLLHTTGLLCCSLQLTHIYILVVKPDNCLTNEAKSSYIYIYIYIYIYCGHTWSKRRRKSWNIQIFVTSIFSYKKTLSGKAVQFANLFIFKAGRLLRLIRFKYRIS